MWNRFLLIVVVVPLAIILVTLAVANRAVVGVTVDPFNAENAALTWHLPLFIWLLLALAIGVIAGSAATWWRQGRYRRLARERQQEVQRLRDAAQRQAVAGPALPKPGI
jgi:uncharacterized integral membrane protein